MALSKEDISDLAKVFATALAAQAATPSPPDAEAARKRAEHGAKRKDITLRTHKTKTHARYLTTVATYIAGQGLVPAGRVVTVPVKHVPSHTWIPVDAKGLALDPVPPEDGVEPEVDDELEAADADEGADEADPDTKPAPKATAKPAKGAVGGRASDKDVA